jgi:hypothetical protein
MNCHTLWNREFLDMHLTISFMKGPYKRYREETLLEREVALLPASQNMVQHHKEKQALERQYTALDDVITNLYLQIERIKHEQRQIKRGINVIVDSQFKQSSGLFADMTLTTLLNTSGPSSSSSLSSRLVDTRRLFHCPHENCRGFMDGSYHCMTCDGYACTECGCSVESQNDHHQCDPAILESHRILLSDSKPCPSCCVPIYKVQDGACNQMYEKKHK